MRVLRGPLIVPIISLPIVLKLACSLSSLSAELPPLREAREAAREKFYRLISGFGLSRLPMLIIPWALSVLFLACLVVEEPIEGNPRKSILPTSISVERIIYPPRCELAEPVPSLREALDIDGLNWDGRLATVLEIRIPSLTDSSSISLILYVCSYPKCSSAVFTIILAAFKSLSLRSDFRLDTLLLRLLWPVPIEFRFFSGLMVMRLYWLLSGWASF